MPEYYCNGDFILRESYANEIDNKIHLYGDIYNSLADCKKEHPNEEIIAGYYVEQKDYITAIIGDSPDWFSSIEEAKAYIINSRYNYLWEASLKSKPTETAPNITYENLDDFLTKEFNTTKESLDKAGIHLDRKIELEMDVENQLYRLDALGNPSTELLKAFLEEKGTSIEEMEKYLFDLTDYKDEELEY